MSSIQQWHVGKLATLWGVCAFWFWVVMKVESEPFVLVWLAYMLFCLVVTWVWFGGREGKR